MSCFVSCMFSLFVCLWFVIKVSPSLTPSQSQSIDVLEAEFKHHFPSASESNNNSGSSDNNSRYEENCLLLLLCLLLFCLLLLCLLFVLLVHLSLCVFCCVFCIIVFLSIYITIYITTYHHQTQPHNSQPFSKCGTCGSTMTLSHSSTLLCSVCDERYDLQFGLGGPPQPSPHTCPLCQFQVRCCVVVVE